MFRPPEAARLDAVNQHISQHHLMHFGAARVGDLDQRPGGGQEGGAVSPSIMGLWSCCD